MYQIYLPILAKNNLFDDRQAPLFGLAFSFFYSGVSFNFTLVIVDIRGGGPIFRSFHLNHSTNHAESYLYFGICGSLADF